MSEKMKAPLEMKSEGNFGVTVRDANGEKVYPEDLVKAFNVVSAQVASLEEIEQDVIKLTNGITALIGRAYDLSNAADRVYARLPQAGGLCKKEKVHVQN